MLYFAKFPRSDFTEVLESNPNISDSDKAFIADACCVMTTIFPLSPDKVLNTLDSFKGVFEVDSNEDPSIKAYLYDDAIYIIEENSENRRYERLAHELCHLFCAEKGTCSLSKEIMTQGLAARILKELDIDYTMWFEKENFCNSDEVSIVGNCYGMGYNIRNSAWTLLKHIYHQENIARYYFENKPLPERIFADGTKYLDQALTANIYYEPAYRDKKLLELANMELGYNALHWLKTDFPVNKYLESSNTAFQWLPALSIDGEKIYPKAPLVNSDMLVIAKQQGLNLERIKGLFQKEPLKETWELSMAMSVLRTLDSHPLFLNDVEYAIKGNSIYIKKKDWHDCNARYFGGIVPQADTIYGKMPPNTDEYFCYGTGTKLWENKLPSGLEWKPIEIPCELLDRPIKPLKEVVADDLGVFYFAASSRPEDLIKYGLAINSRALGIARDTDISNELMEEILDAGLMESWSYNYSPSKDLFLGTKLPSGRSFLQVGLDSPNTEFPFKVLKCCFEDLHIPDGVDINTRGLYKGVEVNLLECYLEFEPQKYKEIDTLLNLGMDLNDNSNGWSPANRIALSRDINLVAIALSHGATMEQIFKRPSGEVINDFADTVKSVINVTDTQYTYNENGELKTVDIPENARESIKKGLKLLEKMQVCDKENQKEDVEL